MPQYTHTHDRESGLWILAILLYSYKCQPKLAVQTLILVESGALYRDIYQKVLVLIVMKKVASVWLIVTLLISVFQVHSFRSELVNIYLFTNLYNLA